VALSVVIASSFVVVHAKKRVVDKTRVATAAMEEKSVN